MGKAFVSLLTRLLLAGALCLPGMAQRYSFRHYGPESGLENNTVLSLLQDRAGFLWVGTEGGLYRYEGSHFRLMSAKEGLACLAEVKGLLETRDGALWAVACNRVYRRENGLFEAVTSEDWVVPSLQGFLDDGQGHILLGTNHGLMQIDTARDAAGHFRVEPRGLGESLSRELVSGVFREHGTIWFGCGRHLCTVNGTARRVYGLRDGLPDDRWDAIQVLDSGAVWLRSATQTYRRLPGESVFSKLADLLPPSFFGGFLYRDRQGTLFVPTDAGLAMISGGELRLLAEADGLKTAMTSTLVEDREGSIWVGTTGQGLERWIGRAEWENWTKADGLPSNLIWNIFRARRDGSLWIGTGQGIMRLAPNGKKTVWGWKEGLGFHVRWLGEAPDGAIWAILPPKRVVRLDPITGRIKFFGDKDGIPASWSVRGHFDRAGRFWVATLNGLFVSDRPDRDARFRAFGSGPARAWDVADDPNGTIWVSSSGGLWRYGNGTWKTYTKKEGLNTDTPYVLLVGPDGALWIRHRYDGVIERDEFSGDRLVRSTPIQPRDAPAELVALHGFDSQGRLWVGASHGLSILENPNVYAKTGQGQPRWLYATAEDGLIDDDCDGEAFWADKDGSVWIGTSAGLSHYSPQGSGLSAEAAPGEAIITNIQTSQQTRTTRIEFSSLSFKTEGSAQFAYRVDDGNWILAKERAVTVAGLSPGDHAVEVKTRAWAHDWSPHLAKARFRFEPFWWEMWWARALFLLLAFSLVTAALRTWLWWQRRKAMERNLILAEKARAEAASQAKSAFLAHMSHEIRTPLNEIIGLAEILSGLPLDERAVEPVGLLQSSSKGLLGLLNGVLDFSKIEAGKLDIEQVPFHLPACIRESAAAFAGNAKNKGLRLMVEFSGDVPDVVIGDGMRLRQVLMSLISNALKFTRQGEVTVSVVAESAPDGRLWVSFRVKDTGIGIPSSRMDQLFRPFTQVDASITRHYGGTGLGLTISKSLVDLMGGSIGAESCEGEGSTFYFRLPFTLAERRPEVPPNPTGITEPNALRILVAEDNKVNQRVLLRLIERLGYRADVAADGVQALDAAQKANYDLIVMDVQMPEMDGLEATREIRRQVPPPRQPFIVALTAHATTDDRAACFEAGMNDYLTKPIDLETLNATLTELSALAPDELHRLAAGRSPVRRSNGSVATVSSEN